MNLNSSSIRPLKVGIFGTPTSSGNRGVQALGESLAKLCRASGMGAEVVVFGSDRSGEAVTMRPSGTPIEVQVVHWRLSPKSKLRHHLGWIVLMAFLYRILPDSSVQGWISRQTPWIRALEEMDLVGDIRGGDSFSDIYGLQRFLISSLSIWTVIAVKGSVVHFPQTYGPYKSRTARMLARYLLRKSSCIIARDTRSRAVAQDLLGSGGEVLLSPDVAFALEPVSVPEPLLNEVPEARPFDPKSTIGINVNGLMYHGGYTGANEFGLKLVYPAFLEQLIRRLLEQTDADILLVPHTYAVVGDVESDNGACATVRGQLPESLRSRVRIVVGEYDAHELKGIIGVLDFFVGSRMHSCIAALSQGVPCVGVAYSMKFAGVFESVGAGDEVIDGRSVDTAEAVDAVIGIYSRRDAIREPLKERAERARFELHQIFEAIHQTALGASEPSNSLEQTKAILES